VYATITPTEGITGNYWIPSLSVQGNGETLERDRTMNSDKLGPEQVSRPEYIRS
jgi:hypothetical protein